jgi:hypothetical protein
MDDVMASEVASLQIPNANIQTPKGHWRRSRRRLFGVWPLGFGVWREALCPFGFWILAFGIFHLRP